MQTWQLQEAKAKLSELVDKAQSEGPQTITRHGTETAVVLSMADYRRLAQGRKSFVEHLLFSGPKFDDFEIPRNDDRPREVDLGD